MKHAFLKSILFLLGWAFALQAAERPNILYFYVDDMGWGSIGPNGQAERRAAGKMAVLTPHLDQLAAEGVNFTRAYGATVCSPARSSQQTGFHQGHTFADRNDPDNAKKAIRADDLTMGDVLQKAGYTTGYWGKWGYGGSKDMQNPTIDNLQTLPTSHGYQHVVAELHHVRAHTFFQPTLWVAPADKDFAGGLMLKPNTMKSFVGNDRYPQQPSNHDHPDYPDVAYCDDVYAFAALDFVRDQAKEYAANGKPFFGLVAFQVPHSPYGEITRLPEWDKAYAEVKGWHALSAQAKQWAAMVTRIDAHIGNILAALEDPDGDGDKRDSVADNTLVVFQSDNGAAGNAGLKEFASNADLRGAKGSIYEGGIRVPTICRWPARMNDASSLKAGSESTQVLDVSDLLPTFAELAGVSAPLGIDGVSYAPYLSGRGNQRPRDFIIHEAGSKVSIIRGRYKLVAGRKTVSGYKHKGVQQSKGTSLYDLEADQSETTNIADKHPELVKALEALLVDERVIEPHGFANTYHRWTGKDGASMAHADNWSDYVYANAGIEYMKDAGAPQLSWTAFVENKGKRQNMAIVDKNMNVLGLELRGEQARQFVVVPQHASLHARNELRVSKGGVLVLEGGEVSSLRALNVAAGGAIAGSGRVQADLVFDEAANLYVAPGIDVLKVDGTVFLDGTLGFDPIHPARTKDDGKCMILQAASVKGRFKTSDLDRYVVTYTDQAVFVELKKP